jgi:hypothetical protein
MMGLAYFITFVCFNAIYAKSIFTIYTPFGSREVFVASGTWITAGI